MKWTIAIALVVASVAGASAQLYQPPIGGNGLNGTGSNPSDHAVSGYTRNNGTYVQPHYQTNPNSTQRDNYGSFGNVNPHTGAVGTHHPRY